MFTAELTSSQPGAYIRRKRDRASKHNVAISATRRGLLSAPGDTTCGQKDHTPLQILWGRREECGDMRGGAVQSVWLEGPHRPENTKAKKAKKAKVAKAKVEEVI